MTTLTNKYGIDEAIVQAIEGVERDHKRVGDISVTGLILPPQMAYMERVHDGEITEDASERLWALMGSAVHMLLAMYTNIPGARVEETLTTEVAGWTVSGTPDIWTPDAHLIDYKHTSVWSFLLGEKDEWEQQINLYAALLRRHGRTVKTAHVSALLRDHLVKRTYEQDYPPIPFLRRDIPVWPEAEAEAFLERRVRIHQQARAGQYEACTPAERWERPTRYAVMKNGRKRALRVLDTEEEALEWAEVNASGHYIDTRPGESVRCASYCRVRTVCGQGLALTTPEYE